MKQLTGFDEKRRRIAERRLKASALFSTALSNVRDVAIMKRGLSELIACSLELAALEIDEKSNDESLSQVHRVALRNVAKTLRDAGKPVKKQSKRELR